MKKHTLFALTMIVAIPFASACGFHVHTFASDWTYDENTHWHKATCEHTDVKGNEAPHAFDEGEIIDVPTPEKKGKKKFTCTVCTYSYTKEIEYIPVKKIELSTESVTIEQGKTSVVVATVLPADAFDKTVSWSSDNEAVAKVDAKGTITAVKTGKATITVKSKQNESVKATCNVTVIDKEKFDYKVGETVIKEYRSKTISNEYIDVYTPVTNTGNVNIAVKSCSYDVKNSKGDTEDSISDLLVNKYPDIIEPGETVYCFVHKSYTGKETTGLVATPHLNVINAKMYDNIRYEITDSSVQKDDIWVMKGVGTVKNNTTKDSTWPYVAMNVFDKDGKFLASEMTNFILDPIKAGESRSFSISAPLTISLQDDITFEDIGNVQFVAYERQLII